MSTSTNMRHSTAVGDFPSMQEKKKKKRCDYLQAVLPSRVAPGDNGILRPRTRGKINASRVERELVEMVGGWLRDQSREPLTARAARSIRFPPPLLFHQLTCLKGRRVAKTSGERRSSCHWDVSL